ncbi:putative SAP30-binding protein [Septoria linicola]|nr:putative SAP30-binding protein [Septoria linicola]
MNALVAYGSSDEEDEEIQPEKPAKIAKTDANVPATLTSASNGMRTAAQQSLPVAPIDNGPAQGPSAGPAMAAAEFDNADDAPFDPYAFERQRLRELTMPTIPNFDIPDSPSPPLNNSEEAAVLAATSKKFERFLELKKQGVHFNDRLQSSASLRNPSLLPKLMDFAGITREESYASSLSEEVAVPVRWPEECYIEGLLKQNDRREKKRLQERDKVDFVPAKSVQSSANGTPGGGSAAGPRKSKFDRK